MSTHSLKSSHCYCLVSALISIGIGKYVSSHYCLTQEQGIRRVCFQDKFSFSPPHMKFVWISEEEVPFLCISWALYPIPPHPLFSTHVLRVLFLYPLRIPLSFTIDNISAKSFPYKWIKFDLFGLVDLYIITHLPFTIKWLHLKKKEKIVLIGFISLTNPSRSNFAILWKLLFGKSSVISLDIYSICSYWPPSS